MNQKQLATIEKFESAIKSEVDRLSRGSNRYRVDSIIFHKISKKLLSWVQNAIPRSSIDESKEVQDLLEYLTHIVVSPFVLTKFFEITFDYKMANCQFVLVKGLFDQADFNLVDRQVVVSCLSINRSNLLPETITFAELMK